MRVLLISANTETINMPVFPLGLACVAEAVQSAGHEIKLVDLMDQHDARLVLGNAISEFQPEIIGISVRNIDDQCMAKPRFLLDSVKDVVSDCRRFTDVPITLGGAGYSIFPESALEYLGAEMGIQGEGEIAFVTLLERLSQKEDLSGISGIYLSGKGLQGKTRHATDLNECVLPILSSHQLTLPQNTCHRLLGRPKCLLIFSELNAELAHLGTKSIGIHSQEFPSSSGTMNFSTCHVEHISDVCGYH